MQAGANPATGEYPQFPQAYPQQGRGALTASRDVDDPAEVNTVDNMPRHPRQCVLHRWSAVQFSLRLATRYDRDH
jgi:hypothetical protein